MTTADELVGKPAADILRGLPPQLVLDLADLYGSTMDDLETTMQLCPYSDRATLMAYGALEKGKHYIVVKPLLLDLVKSAHDIKMHLANEKIGIKDVTGFLDGT